MIKKRLDLIQKSNKITTMVGIIIDSLKSNSTCDAPSIRAVNQEINKSNSRIVNLETKKSIFNDLNIDNKIEVAPSIDLMLRLLSQRNILINGDFQCNQREKVIYNSNGYNLDMWTALLYDGNTISPIPGGGIHISKTSTEQVVERQYNESININDVGKKYTMVLDIETDIQLISNIGFGNSRYDLLLEKGRKIYSKTFTLSKDDISSKGVDCLIFNNLDSIAQVKIFSADLFEGEIVYPHVKEDYSLALLRCLQYVEKIKQIFLYNYATTVNVTICNNFQYFRKTKTPTITYENSTFTYADKNKFSINCMQDHAEFIYFTTTNNVGCYIVLESVLISCEPL